MKRGIVLGVLIERIILRPLHNAPVLSIVPPSHAPARTSFIPTARMNAGGTRVELGRERVILATYRNALGPHGPALADAVLQVCRGRR